MSVCDDFGDFLGVMLIGIGSPAIAFAIIYVASFFMKESADERREGKSS